MHPISFSLKNTVLFLLIPFFSLPTLSANKTIRGEISSNHTVTDPLNAASAYFDGLLRSSDPDTVNIMALRVQFAPDSLKTTTGNGQFDLSTESEYLIDRPPHDKVYFEHQLLALKNYFHEASNGKLVIEYQVFPPQNDGAYQTSNDMIYYSGEEDEEKQQMRWAELLRDGVAAAEAQDNPDFEQFDAFIIYHAGVGKDFAFDFTETPFDIQSAYIDINSLRETIGEDDPDYKGIPAGNTFIQSGIILPEQQSQKEISLGLLGTTTLLFGSQIGMPSLFQTETGRAGIGQWGLMDQGSYNYFGLIPALPSAWERVYMGWEEVVTITTLEEAVLGSPKTSSAPHLYKIPITSTEYYLLENRQEDINGDRITYGRDENGVRVKFDSTGTIVAEQGLGVITEIDEYDYGLPGSGILIWHIDDNVIRENLESNTINNNPEHRGVDLVECDGPQDMGQSYSMFTPGYGTDAGDYWDAYWSGNISHKYINGENPVEFSSTTIPPSLGHNRSATHIRIYNISDKDTLMTFSIGNDWHVPGFPQYIGEEIGPGGLNYVKLEDGSNGVIAVSKSGKIYGWRGNGEKIIANDLAQDITDVTGAVSNWPVALMADVGATVSLPVMVDDYKRDGSQEIIIVDDDGVLTIWSTKDDDGDGRADLLKRMAFDEKLTSPPIFMFGAGTENGSFVDFDFDDDRDLIGGSSIKIADAPIIMQQWIGADSELKLYLTASGDVLAFDRSDNQVWDAQAFGSGDTFYALTFDANSLNNDKDIICIISGDGYLTIINSDGAILNEGRRYIESGVASAPAVADVDGDGQVELLIAGENNLYAFEPKTGAATLNFPVPINNVSESGDIAAPIWLEAELQGEPSHSLVATAGGQILSFDVQGRLNDGFPLALGGGISGTPMLFYDAEINVRNAVVAVSEDGFVYAWDLNQSTLRHWDRFGGDWLGRFYYDEHAAPVVAADEIMPKKKVFCYPNPAESGRTFIRYTLNEMVDQVSIQIYDIAGAQVTVMNAGGVTRGDHEVIWDVTTVQSGAYFARVEAQTTNGNEVEFIKIAVVK